MYAWYPQRTEENIEFPLTELHEVISHNVGLDNQNLVW